MSFGASVRKTANKQLAQVDKKIEDIAIDLFQTAVRFSPAQPTAQHSKGEFINNWNAATNGYNRAKRGSYSSSGTGSFNSINGLRGGKAFFRKDGFVTLTNNLPYAGLVEFKGWQAPKWSGRVGPYAPVRKAFITVVPKYKK